MNIKNRDTNNLIPGFEQFIETANVIAGQTAIVIRTIEKYSKTVLSALNKFENQLQDVYLPIAEQLVRSLDQLPTSLKNAIITCANHGWFCDMEMPWTGLCNLQKALSDGNVEAAEKALVEYFSGRLDEIENSINGKYPPREKIIKSAFAAHRRGEYELSIPVFLIQVDGICYELTNYHFFRSKNKKPRTAIYVEQMTFDASRAALLQPLAQTLPINQPEDKRNSDFNELNRHMVLHGESIRLRNKGQ